MKKAKIIVPAVALLALGVAGSTLGTVAWYAADALATAKSSVNSVTIGTNLDSADGVDCTVLFTFTTTVAPELSDSAGDCYYLVGGYKTKNSDGNPVGTYAVSVSMSAEDIAKWNNSTAHDSTETYTVDLTSTNEKLVLLADDQSAADSNKAASNKHVITFTITAAGAVQVTKVNGDNGSAGYFAVRGSESAENKSTVESSLSVVATFSLTTPSKQS